MGDRWVAVLDRFSMGDRWPGDCAEDYIFVVIMKEVAALLRCQI